MKVCGGKEEEGSGKERGDPEGQWGALWGAVRWAGACDAGGSSRHKQCWGGRRAAWRPEPRRGALPGERVEGQARRGGKGQREG